MIMVMWFGDNDDNGEHEAKVKSSDSTGRGINFVSENKWKRCDISISNTRPARCASRTPMLSLQSAILIPSSSHRCSPSRFHISDQSSPKKSKVDNRHYDGCSSDSNASVLMQVPIISAQHYRTMRRTLVWATLTGASTAVGMVAVMGMVAFWSFDLRCEILRFRPGLCQN